MRLLDRRAFLAMAGAGFAATLAPAAAEAFERADAVFGAACMRPDGRFGCALFTEEGRVLRLLDLPDRGHDVTFDPVSRRAVAFARRPGTFAVVFDPAKGVPLHTIASVEGRHFFGHGFFSPDGRLLFATENEIATAAGLIGVYDATDAFRRVGEFPTHGMDPHEAMLMPDGRTIVVANGGIETYPDYGRQKLNLPTMDPSLVFLDAATGALIEQHRTDKPLHQLSIRHLAVDARTNVWFGCQYEGDPADRPALVGHAALGKSLELVALDPAPLDGLDNYVGSVVADRAAERIAFASPKGNSILVLDAATGRLAETHTLKNGCGLAPLEAGFLATSGDGLVMDVATDSARQTERALQWDNHILPMPDVI